MKEVAIVTGASRGIGRAVAKRLAIDGFGVVVKNVYTKAWERVSLLAESARLMKSRKPIYF